MFGFHFSLQIELDKAAEDFRRVHHDRQELIKQWENTIEQMRKRDQEIDNCGLVINFLRCGLLAVHVGFLLLTSDYILVLWPIGLKSGY